MLIIEILTASKNHKHSVNNPYSQFRDGWSVDQIKAAPKITRQLTKFMCSPTSVRPSDLSFIILFKTHSFFLSFSFLLNKKDGAAACVVASEDFVHKHGLENQAIEIVAMHLTTDGPETFEGRSPMDVVGYQMAKTCANKVFADAGFGPGQGRDQVGVVELHDCFAANEVCGLLHPG
jgi:sterol carrier protein 2